MPLGAVGQRLWDDALVDELRHSERLRRQLAAHQARIIDELDRRTTYRRDGHASICGLIRTVTRQPTAEAKRLARRSRLLREHPAVEAALATGDLGVAQADLLARASTHPRCSAASPPASTCCSRRR